MPHRTPTTFARKSRGMKVTFIGLGIMGSRMAGHLVSENIELTVFNRDMDKAQELVAKGARAAKTMRDAVQGADVVFTMLSTPEVVADLSNGSEGFLQHMPKNSLWVDCSTVSPEDVQGNLTAAAEAGIRFLEAPVAGTKQPAEKGELVFFVGGKKDDLPLIDSLLGKMGKKTIYMGEHGAAATIKIVVNLMLAQSMLAFSESVKLGVHLGLSRDVLLNVLLNVPVTAPFLQNVRGKLESGDLSPNFPLQWMAKDLALVQQAADDKGIELPSAAIAGDLFHRAMDEGMGTEDFSSIFHATIGSPNRQMAVNL